MYPNEKEAPSLKEELGVKIGNFVEVAKVEDQNSMSIDCGCDEMGPDCCDDVCSCDTD